METFKSQFMSRAEAVSVLTAIRNSKMLNMDFYDDLSGIISCLEAEERGIHIWSAPQDCEYNDYFQFNNNSEGTRTFEYDETYLKRQKNISRTRAVSTLCYIRDMIEERQLPAEYANDVADITMCIFMELYQYHIWDKSMFLVCDLFGISLNSRKKIAVQECRFTPSAFEKDCGPEEHDFPVELMQKYMPAISWLYQTKGVFTDAI